MTTASDYGVSVSFTASNAEAWALAELVKRILYDDLKRLSASEEELFAMSRAIHLLRMALGSAGYAPR